MLSFLKIAIIAGAASSALVAPTAYAGLSDASLVSVLISGSVLLVPLSLVVEGSKAIGTSFANVSNAVRTEPNWTVKQVTEVGSKTQMMLQSSDKATLLTVEAPTAEVKKSGLQINHTVTAKNLGAHSLSFEYKGKPLGVVTDESAGLAYSRKR